MSRSQLFIFQLTDARLALLDWSVEGHTPLTAVAFMEAESVDGGHCLVVELILRVFQVIIAVFTLEGELGQPVIDLLRIVTSHCADSLPVGA